MSVEKWAFYLLSIVSIAGGLAMISCRKPISSLMALVVSFFCLAGLFTMVQAPLVAALQVLIYAGAILVLFLFAIMLLSPKGVFPAGRILGVHPIAAVILTAGLSLFMVWNALVSFPVKGGAYYNMIKPDFGDVASVGEALFGEFLLPFEILSLILLVAIVGATVLAKRRLK